ncbi:MULTISPECIES: amidohydrolase family protein [unclassified Hyphomonas]|uniref:amidohydrolase family protein n=1 Tax=unclassified Hyphomonas TaxID=2630699 RepID=UPI0025BD5275|nr:MULTISPECIES: amidohydrolase family protein [unclassified Hyphomonas]|tara:strand:+ start:2408 stop:3400 length:993 start_codon:yes stop_codon:yes gene_type:complete
MVFNNSGWLAQVQEDIVDPDREIIDPHHHLWPQADMYYHVPEFLADLTSGHNVVQTVFMECGAAYREDGPDHLKPVGETEFVAAAAAEMKAKGGPYIAGIVGHADLRGPHLEDVLDAHRDAANGLFRGIRHAGSRDTSGATLRIPGRAPERLYADEDFRRGVQLLGEHDLSYDTWHYHHQNRDYLDLVKAVPNTTMVLDHFGTPIGIGPYADKREEIFEQWRDDMADLSHCPNVVAKLGGLAMPDNGWGWHERETPPTSDEFVLAQQRYYDHMIDCFGAARCMFESNFPVDRWSISYPVLWNGLKKIAAKYSEVEQRALFTETARRIYRL